MRRFHSYAGIRCLVFYLIAAVAPPGMAETLEDGIWTGSYSLYRGETLDVTYKVEKLITEEEVQLRIVMSLDLEPRSNFIHLLEDVIIGDDEISFKFKKPQETKSCSLKLQTNSSYLGYCRSDRDSEGERLNQITMIPPQEL